MLAETWIPTTTQDCTGTNSARGVTYELLTDTFTVQKIYSGFCMQQCRRGGGWFKCGGIVGDPE